MGRYQIRGMVFGVLAVVLLLLVGLWWLGASEDEVDRKLGLRDRCALVEQGWTLERLHRHFKRRGWDSGCLLTEPCETVEIEGDVHRYRCNDRFCQVTWQWESWRCDVKLFPKSRLSMGAGTLDTHSARHEGYPAPTHSM